MGFCSAPIIDIDGVPISTSDFENARELIETVSGDQGDPTLDEYEENIANGNNTSNTTGIQLPTTAEGQPPKQSTNLPAPIPVPADQSNDKPPPGGNGNVPDEISWSGDYNQTLGANFTVKSFTIGALFPNPLIDYTGTNINGSTVSYNIHSRINNLNALAINVAEPLRAKFGPFSINSGIRNKTSTRSGISQHITGQGFDIQFPGWTYAKYWENAQWVKDNIPYDQFIFEHSDKTGLAWFHLSFNRAGNRPASDRTKVMTMYRNCYDTGLKRYG